MCSTAHKHSHTWLTVSSVPLGNSSSSCARLCLAWWRSRRNTSRGRPATQPAAAAAGPSAGPACADRVQQGETWAMTDGTVCWKGGRGPRPRRRRRGRRWRLHAAWPGSAIRAVRQYCVCPDASLPTQRRASTDISTVVQGRSTLEAECMCMCGNCSPHRLQAEAALDLGDVHSGVLGRDVGGAGHVRLRRDGRRRGQG